MAKISLTIDADDMEVLGEIGKAVKPGTTAQEIAGAIFRNALNDATALFLFRPGDIDAKLLKRRLLEALSED